MLKLVREEEDVFVIVTDKPGYSGRGSFKKAIRQLLRLRVPLDEIHLAVDELEKDRGPEPKHNVVEFGIGFGDGRPKFIFTQHVNFNAKIKGVA